MIKLPGNNSEIERKLRSLEKQIQQLRNNEVLMKVTDLDWDFLYLEQ